MVVVLLVIQTDVSRMTDEVDRLRLRRFLFSCLLLFLAFQGIANVSRALNISPVSWFLLLACYLLAGGFLMAVIVGRLYDQHELKRFRFDLTNAVLLTTLIALPMGFANIQWYHFFQNLPAAENPDQSTALVISTAIALFLLLPTLFITEALLTWYLWFRKRKMAR